MAAVVALKRPPSDLAARLRGLADAADRGDLTDMVICYAELDEFGFLLGTSKTQGIAMATMLQAHALEAMRR